MTSIITYESHLQCVDFSSNKDKFYKVYVKSHFKGGEPSHEMYTKYGRNGTSGVTTKSKYFANFHDAFDEASKKTESKLNSRKDTYTPVSSISSYSDGLRIIDNQTTQASKAKSKEAFKERNSKRKKYSLIVASTRGALYALGYFDDDENMITCGSINKADVSFDIGLFDVIECTFENNRFYAIKNLGEYTGIPSLLNWPESIAA